MGMWWYYYVLNGLKKSEMICWVEMGRFYNELWLVLVIGKSESDDEMNWMGWECNGEDMNGYVMILFCFEWFEKEWNDF